MSLSRMDLDGKGAGSPEGIVALILKGEPDLPIPVPIEKLCFQFDIKEIQPLETEGFEGGLITTPERTTGIILVNERSHRFRRRFTIGHELGHFLIPTHMPDADGRFLCSARDMRLLSANENDRRARMEVEANRFSSLLLIPPPRLRAALKLRPDPSIEHMVELAGKGKFEVSKQAMARAYAQYHAELLAFVIVRNGIVEYSTKHLKFPYIVVNRGQKVPAGSLFARKPHAIGMASEIAESVPDLWINVERGRAAPTLYEQVLLQRDGHALIMLWVEIADSEDEQHDDDRTAKQRYRDRMAQYDR